MDCDQPVVYNVLIEQAQMERLMLTETVAEGEASYVYDGRLGVESMRFFTSAGFTADGSTYSINSAGERHYEANPAKDLAPRFLVRAPEPAAPEGTSEI